MSERTSADKSYVVLAAAAHPDDIEFGMAGTLLLLKQAGAEIHLFNLANGSCGTSELSREEIVALRLKEAQASADLIDAVLHPPLVDDFQIFYEPRLISHVAAVIREVKPDIMLIPALEDYMEDHQNAARVLAGAAFVRGMRNYVTDPPVEPVDGEVALYHAMPHGLRDSMRRLIRPEIYVDIDPVFLDKRNMLAKHQSQKRWLDVSQGMDAYLKAMEETCLRVGKMSGRFELAEGFRRHNHLGFCDPGYNPLIELLGLDCWLDPEYQVQ